MSAPMVVTALQTRKERISESRLHTSTQSAQLAAGEVLFKLSRFGLTTNNVTYAALGSGPLNYWAFFPTDDPAWGHVPVWGFAEVVASAQADVAIGERFYGFFPMCSHVSMRPERITERGFTDGVAHRSGLAAVYNQYTRCSADLAYDVSLENHQVLLRPLFLTAFVLADFLLDNGFFGAQQVLVSSASSKTAFGTAYCLQGGQVPLLALTSARNLQFVENLGCYSQVVDYRQLSELDSKMATLYLDFSGDETLRVRLHQHFAKQLTYHCFVGTAQAAHTPDFADLGGAAPQFFFAPTQIRKRIAQWGAEGFNLRFNEQQARFFQLTCAPGNAWLEVHEAKGWFAVPALLDALHAGTVPANVGHTVLLP